MHPLIPAFSFPIVNENSDPLLTLLLARVTLPFASKTVPSAKAVKETAKSQPALISAEKVRLPDNEALYLLEFPFPDLNDNSQDNLPFA